MSSPHKLRWPIQSYGCYRRLYIQASLAYVQVIDHGIPQSLIDQQFALSESFFGLPDDLKAKSPFVTGSNRGWEKGKQVGLL